MSTLFSGHYLRNRSTLDMGVLGYIGIVQHKEYSPEVLSIPPGTPCIFLSIFLSHVINIFFNFTIQSPCLCSIYHSWSYNRFIETNFNLLGYRSSF